MSFGKSECYELLRNTWSHTWGYYGYMDLGCRLSSNTNVYFVEKRSMVMW